MDKCKKNLLRSNNWSIPILVGADFNMDMRNFDLSDHPGNINPTTQADKKLLFAKALRKPFPFVLEFILTASPVQRSILFPTVQSLAKTEG